MSRILLCAFILISEAWAIDANEEALILNQEMQFLEEAAKEAPMISTSAKETSSSQKLNEDNLERKYFGTDMDTIETRSAAPKRRGL